MAKIKVHELEAGMELASDVHDPNGRFLLGKGCELGVKHIKALQAWGVLAVEIEGIEDSGSKISRQVEPEILERIQADVRSRFRPDAIKHELIKELYREVINHECQLYVAGDK